ncbi:MAG TPA: hypothetical protein PK507_01990 [bacterium]|nr:hypothetical protein [bacterium]
MITANLISNIFKIRYEFMNESLGKKPKNNIKYRILMVVDIGKIMRTMINIMCKKNIIITQKHKSQIIVGVLNIIAHYRHYYYSNMKCANSFLLYCQNQEDYDEFEDVIKDLQNICKFIPNLILIPKMKDKVSKYFYIHTASFVVEYTKRTTEAVQKELIVTVLGNNPLEYQFLSICDKTFYLAYNQTNKVMNYKKLWISVLGEDERFMNKRYSYELKQLLIPYMILHKKYIVEGHPILGISNIRMATRISKLFEFIDNVKSDSIPIWEKYIDYIELGEDKKEYLKILDEILYTNNLKIKPFIKDFVKSWSQKLKDRQINNINEYSEVFNKENINILWLQEDRGE